MKKIVWAAMTLAMLLALCACGGGTASSPYLGTWVATMARYEDVEFHVNDIFEGAFVAELKDKGICQLSIGDQSDEVTWSETDGAITISDGEVDLTGTITEDVMVLTLSGVEVTLVREGAESAGTDTGAEDAEGTEAEEVVE